jgi:hypothetical protein
MFHSNESTVGTSPYSLSEVDVQKFLERLRTYFDLLFSMFEVQSIGLSEVTSVA